MKKSVLLSALIITLLTSSMPSASAALPSLLSSSSVTINVTDKKKGPLDLEFKFSSEISDAVLYAAMYLDGEIIQIKAYPLSGTETVTDNITCEKTPDAIYTYIWQNNLKPLSSKENMLDEEGLLAANEPVITQLKLMLSEVDKIYWYGTKQQSIVAKLKECAEDAITLNEKYLLTRQFSQSYYKAQLSEVKEIYDTMTDTELDDFQDRIYEIDADVLSYMIDYFDLWQFL